MTEGARVISVVVPVYNSEQTLPLLFKELQQALGDQQWELILVNDGSRDRSWQVIEQLAATQPAVRGIDLMRNYGQHNALLCGIRAARGDVIVTMDDDLQNPPAEIPRLLAKLDEGYDVIYGKPVRDPHRLLRSIASRLTKLVLQRAMGAETARSVSAFRAFRTVLREAFANYQGSYVSIDVLLTWGTQRFAAVPVDFRPRAVGISNYTIGKLIAHALNMVTGFSTLPLQVASVLGFLMTGFGVAVLVYVFARYLIEGGSVPGFPFLASMIAIFSGAQMFGLGIIGEYLARIHARTMEKPSYSVRRRAGGP